jgi:Beta-ketoacyl synthase, N-terminal domain
MASLLSASELFKHARKIKLPISAAFHASHLGRPDVEGILGSLADRDDRPLRDNVTVISTSSGQSIVARTLGEVLKQIVLDTLQEPLRWSDVVRHLVSQCADGDVKVLSSGPVSAADSLLRHLKSSAAKGVSYAEVRPLHQENPSNGSSDIAIVGIASRLPEAESLEEFWKLLEAGRDVHKKVGDSVCILKFRNNETHDCDRYLKIDLTLRRIAIRLEKPKTAS